MRWIKFWLLAFTISVIALPTKAETNISVTLTSDYLFNGISQTGQRPALQLLVYHPFDSGFYLGTFAATVDFDNGTYFELDPYLGFYRQINDDISIDLGAAFYSYHGNSNSSKASYPEIWLKLGWRKTQFASWYTYDYAGTTAGHYILMLSQRLALAENTELLLQLDKSTSLDSQLFSWQHNDRNYLHGKIMLSWLQNKNTLTLSLEKTDLDWQDKLSIVFAYKYRF